MPNAIQRHRPTLTLKPQRTLKDKQESNGRTLALTSTAWRVLRAAVLSGEPLCRHCTMEGRTVVATDVDHRDNDPTNNDPVNLQPLCHSHHSIKTMTEMHGIRPHGCDVHGMPLDPLHPWNTELGSRNTENHQQPATANRSFRFAHASAVRAK